MGNCGVGRKQGEGCPLPSPRKTFSCLVVRPCWLPRSSEKPPSCTSPLFPLSGGREGLSRGFGGESGLWLAGISRELGVTPFRVWGGAFLRESSSRRRRRRISDDLSRRSLPAFAATKFFPPSSLLLFLLPPPNSHSPSSSLKRAEGGREGRTRRMRSRGGGEKRKGQPRGRGKKRLPSTLPFFSLSPPPPRGKRSGGVGKTVGCTLALYSICSSI